MFRGKGPTMIQNSYSPAFPLKHQKKDMRLALALGDENVVSMPVAAAANEVLHINLVNLATYLCIRERTCFRLILKREVDLFRLCLVFKFLFPVFICFLVCKPELLICRIFSPEAPCEVIEAEMHSHIFYEAETDIRMVLESA